jgi:hypothetical protein
MTAEDIANLQAEVRKISTWDKTQIAFGHVSGKASKSKDSMFEFFCLVWLLSKLEHNYSIRFIPGGKHSSTFPMAPGKKSDWPYFELMHKTDASLNIQICYGTEINFSFDKNNGHSPDISVQNFGSPLKPVETDLLLIFDAKFKNDPNHVLPKDTINGFMQCVNSFQLKDPATLNVDFSSIPDFLSNCLITNGKLIVKHGIYCQRFKVKLVGGFAHDSTQLEFVG